MLTMVKHYFCSVSKVFQKFTLMFGISKRPLLSLEPGGSGLPAGRTHLTRALIGPSSRHWNTTSRPIEKHFA